MRSHSGRVTRQATIFFVLLGLLVLIFLAYLATGSIQFSLPQVVQALLHRATADINDIVWSIRLPRACTCLVVGSMIGLVGSAFQALFRNPLAEPYVIGVSSGASIGAALYLLTGIGGANLALSGIVQMAAGLPFGLAALALVFGLARRRGVVEVHTLLLAGVVVSAMLSALLSFILYAAGEDTGKVLAFLFGHTDTTDWTQVAALTVILVIGSVILYLNTKRMNALSIGEQTAQRLGIHVGSLKSIVLVTSTVMVSVTVGAVGIIGFLGLVAPHLSRRVLGVDWRWSLPGAGVLGAAVLLVSDELAQRLPGSPLPVGIVTSLIGAPFLLVLLKRKG